MSTTFDVFPRTATIPSFAALIERSTAELHRFLGSVGVHARPGIEVSLRRGRDHEPVDVSLEEPARWAPKDYAWFQVGGVPGGTDAYFDDDAKAIDEYWEGMFDDPRSKRLEPLIRECINVGHYWSFRRSIGQPAIVNLAYGMIAGSLAAITDGLISSYDGAWEPQRFPALPDEFLSWYFRPEVALDENLREWSQRCIGHLAEELGSADK